MDEEEDVAMDEDEDEDDEDEDDDEEEEEEEEGVEGEVRLCSLPVLSKFVADDGLALPT